MTRAWTSSSSNSRGTELEVDSCGYGRVDPTYDAYQRYMPLCGMLQFACPARGKNVCHRPGVLLAWLALPISAGAVRRLDSTISIVVLRRLWQGEQRVPIGRSFQEGDRRQAGRQENRREFGRQREELRKEGRIRFQQSFKTLFALHPSKISSKLSSAQLQPTSRPRSQHRIAPSFLCAAQSPVFGRSALRRRVSYHVWCAAPLQELGSMG